MSDESRIMDCCFDLASVVLEEAALHVTIGDGKTIFCAGKHIHTGEQAIEFSRCPDHLNPQDEGAFENRRPFLVLLSNKPEFFRDMEELCADIATILENDDGK